MVLWGGGFAAASALFKQALCRRQRRAARKHRSGGRRQNGLLINGLLQKRKCRRNGRPTRSQAMAAGGRAGEAVPLWGRLPTKDLAAPPQSRPRRRRARGPRQGKKRLSPRRVCFWSRIPFAAARADPAGQGDRQEVSSSIPQKGHKAERILQYQVKFYTILEKVK